MRYHDLALQNLQSPDPDIARAAIRYIEAEDAVENARLAVDQANQRLFDAQGDFLSQIGQ